MKWLIPAMVLVVAGASGVYWFFGAGQSGGLGVASPVTDAPVVAFDWVLAEGELLQGTEELDVPEGVNVAIEVDNDVPDTLVIGGYDAEFELGANSIIDVAFHTYRKGQFPIRLKSGDRLLGTLNVVESE